MTTWKLINSFIQPKLLLLFISVTVPILLSLSQFPVSLPPLQYLPQIHPPAPHLTSSLVRELPINHRCCLTLSIFPETQGGCCRNWVRHNLQGSRAWLVMTLLGNVAISGARFFCRWNAREEERGSFGVAGLLGVWVPGWGPLVSEVTTKEKPADVTVVLLYICVCTYVPLRFASIFECTDLFLNWKFGSVPPNVNLCVQCS